ncbi:MAG TPA: AI-2E family transporter [Candidatus Acidoferrales bacterium]|nr:AI-2E family transporter [Candidatus Acidoferrales bacterium]
MSEATVSLPPWRGLLRPIAIVAALIVFLFIVRRIPLTVETFIVATLIAYGINPVIRFLQKRIPRLAAIVIVYVLFILIIIIGAAVVVPTVIEQLQTLFANSGDYLTATQNFINNEEAWINKHFGHHMLPPQFNNLEDAALNQLSGMLQNGLTRVGGFVVSVASAVIVGVTAVVLSYYLLVNAYSIRQTFLELFPQRAESKARRFVHEVQRIFGGFVGGQIILSAFCAVFTFLGLELIQSQYALLLGVLTGLLYAIPYIGVFAAIAIGVLLGLLQSWEVAVWTAVIMFVVTKIADTLLVPKVMSESVGVSPMGIIFSVFAGGELFGLWGLLLAIPAAALFKALWVVWIYPWLTGREAPNAPTAPT